MQTEFTSIVQQAVDLSVKFLNNEIPAQKYVPMFEDLIADDDEGETSQEKYVKIFGEVHEWIALYNPDPEFRATNEHLIEETELRQHVTVFLKKLGVNNIRQ